jgi:hypothetical protein
MADMRVLQLLTANAPAYERKLQIIDRAFLEGALDVITWSESEEWITADERSVNAARFAEVVAQPRPDVIHVYGPMALPHTFGRNWTAPWVAAGRPAKRRFSLRTPPPPSVTIASTGDDAVPEAVGAEYLRAARAHTAKMAGRRLIGSIGRGAEVREMVEAVFARLARFRDDIDWNVYEAFPSNEEMDQVDVWVDPAVADDDLDGFVAEALVRGRLVVASRTPINAWRLAGGKFGFLARRADPNEMAHAIATALFKPETGEERLGEPSAHAARFSAAERGARLLSLYRQVTA